MTTRTTGSPTSTDTAAARPLRTWQRRALTRYLTDRPKDFLAVATPGAGKTTFALRVAAELLGDRSVDTVTIVCPTEHLKHQWAEAAGAAGLAIDPEFSNAVGRTSTDFRGVAVTYAQVAAHPVLHMNRTEGRAHPGDLRRDPPRGRRQVLGRGDARGVRGRDAPAGAHRDARSGRDDNPIPFITYEPDSAGRAALAAPTTPTATPTRWPTASSARSSSSRTRARRAGAPARARR